MNKVEAKDVSLQDLKHDFSQGFQNRIYRFTVQVPQDYIQRQEEGPLMAFNVSEKNLYEVMLAAKRAYVNSIQEGIAEILVEVGSPYLDIALRDLKKVKSAVVLIPESKEEETGV